MVAELRLMSGWEMSSTEDRRPRPRCQAVRLQTFGGKEEEVEEEKVEEDVGYVDEEEG